MTTHVALNARDPSGPVLVALQADLSTAKEAWYRDGGNGTLLHSGLQWASSSNGNYMYPSGVAYVGRLALIGYLNEDYRRADPLNGSEVGVSIGDVGAAVLHSGVEVMGDGRVRVGAQSVLARPTSPEGQQYGMSVGIVEVEEDAEYHIAVGSVAATGGGTVYMYSVEAGGVGGWGVPVVTSLNNLTAQRGADGAVTLQFGDCDGSVTNW